MIGYARKADRAQKYSIVVADAVDAVLRHHGACLRVVLATPGTLIPIERDTEAPSSRGEHFHALRHDLLADAVAGNQRDLVGIGHQLPRIIRPQHNATDSVVVMSSVSTMPPRCRLCALHVLCSRLFVITENTLRE